MRRMLFVDDQWQSWLSMLRKMGRKRGWQVESAPLVEECLKRLTGESFDLVLLDLEFPQGQLQGRSGLRHIRQAYPDLPVIILTGSDTAADLRTAIGCMRLGAWDYFVKTRLDIELLFAEAEKAVASSDARRRHQRLIESFKRAVGKSPAVACFTDDEGATAAFGLRLVGIASLPNENATPLHRQEWVTGQLAWQSKVLSGLQLPQPDWEVELRHLAGGRGRDGIDVLLFGRTHAATQESARATAEELWVDLESLLAMNDENYPFVAIQDEDELREALVPFEPKRVTEIRRTGMTVSLGGAPGVPGFGVSARSSQPEHQVVVPRTLQPGARSLLALCEVAAHFPHPLLIAVTLSAPTPMEREPADALQNTFNQRAGYGMRLVSDGGERDLTPEEYQLLQTRAQALGEGDAFVVRLLVAGERAIPRAALNVIGSELLSERASDWGLVPWSEAEVEAARRPYGLHPPRLAELDALTCMFTRQEATAPFRLPVAADGSLPGIPPVRPQFSYLPDALPERGTLLGRKPVEGTDVDIRITEDDRRKHVYILGQTGTGKSTLLSSMILSDMQEGRGLCVLDPHGDLVEFLLPRVPPERADDVIMFDPSDRERPIGLNLFQWQKPEQRDFLIQEAVLMFYKLFDPGRTGIVGPQWEHWFRNAALALMAEPQLGTLIDVPSMFLDEGYRKSILARVTDPTVLTFWHKQLPRTADFHKSEMTNYFISKFGRFASNEIMRRIIGQRVCTLDLAQVMNDGHILLVNLSKGRLGEMNSSLLGMILMTRLFSAAMGRVDLPTEERRDFCLYVDEFQGFTTDTIAQIVAEARKYGLALVLAHQNLEQLRHEIREAILGNAGTLLTFRTGIPDAGRMALYFRPQFSDGDLRDLPDWTVCARLMAAGRPTQPFTFHTVRDAILPDPELARLIRANSRARYGSEAAKVDAEIVSAPPAIESWEEMLKEEVPDSD